MARERYLLHAGEETINQAGAEIKADNPKAKWKNFWYYHKFHVLIGVVVVLVAGFLIHDVTSVVHADYEVGLITQSSYPEDDIQALETELAKYGKDLNSDGKVVVQVNATTVAADSSNAGDPNVQMAGVVRLDADLSSGTSMIFLTDDASFLDQQKKQQMFSYLDGSVPVENASDFTRMRVALKDCKKLSGLRTGSPDGSALLDKLSISMRVFKGTTLEGKKDKNEYYAASKKLFDQVISAQ